MVTNISVAHILVIISNKISRMNDLEYPTLDEHLSLSWNCHMTLQNNSDT